MKEIIQAKDESIAKYIKENHEFKKLRMVLVLTKQEMLEYKAKHSDCYKEIHDLKFEKINLFAEIKSLKDMNEKRLEELKQKDSQLKLQADDIVNY